MKQSFKSIKWHAIWIQMQNFLPLNSIQTNIEKCYCFKNRTRRLKNNVQNVYGRMYKNTLSEFYFVRSSDHSLRISSSTAIKRRTRKQIILSSAAILSFPSLKPSPNLMHDIVSRQYNIYLLQYVPWL